MGDLIGQQLGNYRLIRLLGQGGFAEVYLGEHVYLKSYAALKVLRTSLQDKDVQRFLAEAQRLVRLRHPHIVRVLEFAIERGTPVLVMEYAPGGTVRQQYPQGSSVPLTIALSYVKQVATALQYAHDHHLIHRDVKPENILFSEQQDLLLSDFGLSLLSPSSDLLSSQEMAGTIPYMAPEQLRGKPCFASDQYALGIVTYEWLCGTRPFVGSPWVIIQQHLSAAPPSLREKNLALPEAVEDVVGRALAKDPQERFVSVQAFARAFERASQVSNAYDETHRSTALSDRADSSFATLPDHQPKGDFLAPSSSEDALEVAGQVSDVHYNRYTRKHLFMAEDMSVDFVARPHEFEALKESILHGHRERPTAIIAALRGAGGYGKTTLAKALCHDKEVQAIFPDGVLWVTLGETSSNLISKMEDLIYLLSRERPGFTSLEAATTFLKELLGDRAFLIVLDDVWHASDLKPFLQTGPRCARLITTRDDSVLPANVQRVQVDAMRPQEAVQLLCAGLYEGIASSEPALSTIVAQLGEWPLLLTLANGFLCERVKRYDQSLPDALFQLRKTLEKRGVIAFDARNAQERWEAVARTLEVSFSLLNADEYARYQEIAVFPEDVAIPLVTVQRLWSATGGLDEVETEALCQRLHRLSLLLSFDVKAQEIRLHDVVRAYLQTKREGGMAPFHAQLLDTYGLTRWADLPVNDVYMWNYLAFHLLSARRVETLVATVKDLRYLATKTYVLRRTSPIEADLSLAEHQAPADTALSLLKRHVANMSHLFNRCETLQEVEVTLHSRLSHINILRNLCRALEGELQRPFLTAWHPLPDLPSSALVRTLYGHLKSVTACAINASGDVIVSASEDQTLKVWDALTGAERHTLKGHIKPVIGCAISASGDIIVSASEDQTLKVWDAHTGAERLTLRGHTRPVAACAISAAGDVIVSASDDWTLKVWDSRTGVERLTLRGHWGPVTGCAINASGDVIVSASEDQTLKVWDAHTGVERLTIVEETRAIGTQIFKPIADGFVQLTIAEVTRALGTLRVSEMAMPIMDTPTSENMVSGAEIPMPPSTALMGPRGIAKRRLATMTGCAISASGDVIVASLQQGMLQAWDAHTGAVRLTIADTRIVTGYGFSSRGVTGCAINASGDVIVSAWSDQTLRVWDAHLQAEDLTLRGHTSLVTGCAINDSGDVVVSASADSMLKVWDIRTGREHLMQNKPADRMYGCAMSAAGDVIVSKPEHGMPKVFDARTGVERLALQGHRGESVSRSVISADGVVIVTASFDGTLKVWNAHTGTELLTLQGHKGKVYDCAISAKGDVIVSASEDQTLKVWDGYTGVERFTLRGHTGPLSKCALSVAGDIIVSASEDQTLKVWDAHTGAKRFTLRGHTDWVNDCAVSATGDVIISASRDSTLRVWEAHTGAVRFTLRHRKAVSHCALNAAGNLIASTSADGTLKIWDVNTGACLTTLLVDGAHLNACAFYPDNEHIVAAGAHGLYFLHLVR